MEKTKEPISPDMLTVANVAKKLGVSEGKVKKAIGALKLEPDAKKGVCNYYGPSSVEKIQANLAS